MNYRMMTSVAAVVFAIALPANAFADLARICTRVSDRNAQMDRCLSIDGCVDCGENKFGGLYWCDCDCDGFSISELCKREAELKKELPVEKCREHIVTCVPELKFARNNGGAADQCQRLYSKEALCADWSETLQNCKACVLSCQRENGALVFDKYATELCALCASKYSADDLCQGVPLLYDNAQPQDPSGDSANDLPAPQPAADENTDTAPRTAGIPQTQEKAGARSCSAIVSVSNALTAILGLLLSIFAVFALRRLHRNRG